MSEQPLRQPAGSGRIRLLAPWVAEAIAAGEVIDRPASAVKELVENSLDAGGLRITVEIEGGGIDLVRVVDDGAGMTMGELEAAFHRHATSKLSSLDDLLQLRTFGFRGEALASIAAVARVTAVSRTSESNRAYSVAIDSDKRRGPAATAAAVGTAITARDLFFNVPARRAFLRSSRAEAAACARAVAEAALGRPDVTFIMRSQGRQVLRVAALGSLAAAIAAVFGSEAAAALLPVDQVDEDLHLTGLIGSPESARSTRQAMVLMVNGRRIHHRGLQAAVEASFRGLLAHDRYPVAVLDLTCDPALVDVNVHPTKREVRFRDERRMFELVQRGCWTALQAAAPRALSLGSQPPAAIPVLADELPSPTLPGLTGSTPSIRTDDEPTAALTEATGWIYLGQLHNRYLLAQTATGLAILDQHAAHEKILYGRWLLSLRRAAGHPHPAQGLLEPILVAASAELLASAVATGLDLERLGFEVIGFGATTLRCSAAPVGLKAGSVSSTLVDLLDIWMQADGGVQLRQHRMAASLACHSAVRFGDHIGDSEAQSLIRDLAGTQGGITCPHGRPAVLLLSGPQLMTAFHRR